MEISKSPKPNHYFDAAYQAIVARSMRGIGVLETPSLPIAEVPAHPWALHINTHLTPDQSLALCRVTAALDSRLARLSNGRRVINRAMR